jgi:hypothetical protein
LNITVYIKRINTDKVPLKFWIYKKFIKTLVAMNRLAITSVVLILLHSIISVYANVKITPIAIDSKSNMKSDLKVEEARFRDPMPEFYDRNRQNFVTSNFENYGNSANDRYGYNNFDRSNYDRYGTRYSGMGGSYQGYDDRQRFGSSECYSLIFFIFLFKYHLNLFSKDFGLNSLGSGYNTNVPYGSKYPYTGGAVYGGPSGTPFNSFTGGLLPPELEQKTSVLLPLAGAALLGYNFLILNTPCACLL